MADEALHCEACDRRVTREAAVATATYGDLDPDRWETLCCPDCGRRLRTVLVRPDE